MRILVDMGAEIDARDDTAWTPLDYTAKNGFFKSMKILLENDAAVDARDKNNNTPLHWAAANGHVVCVSMLLDYGADIALKNIEGKNCLDFAVENFHQETCMGLVTHSRLLFFLLPSAFHKQTFGPSAHYMVFMLKLTLMQ